MPGAILAGDATITVTSGAAFSTPTTGEQCVVRIDDTGTPGSVVFEYALMTANSANVFTVTRGQEGTSAHAFGAGATVTEVLTQGALTNLPRGSMGYVQVTADQGSITTLVDLTSLTLTVIVGTGRRLRVSAECSMQSTIAADSVGLTIVEGATTLQTSFVLLGGIGIASHCEAVAILTPSAGTHTYKLQGQRANGSGTVTMKASATQPAFILVEDIGV